MSAFRIRAVFGTWVSLASDDSCLALGSHRTRLCWRSLPPSAQIGLEIFQYPIANKTVPRGLSITEQFAGTTSAGYQPRFPSPNKSPYVATNKCF